MRESEALYGKMSTLLERLTEIRFLYSLLRSRRTHLNALLTKWTTQHLKTIVSQKNESLNNTMMKIMKLKDMEKKITEKKKYKEQFVNDAHKLFKLTSDDSVKDVVDFVNREWSALEDRASNERQALDELLCIWKELKRAIENLEVWLMNIKKSASSVDDVEPTASMLLKQVEMLVLYHEELKRKEKEKERILKLKEAFDERTLCSEIELSVENLQQLWTDVDNMLVTRMDFLFGLKRKVENGHVEELMCSLRGIIATVEEDYDEYEEQTFTCSLDLQMKTSSLEV